MPKTYIQNELGQKVRVIQFKDLLIRLKAMKVYKGDVDLNGKWLVVRHTWGIGDILYSTAALRGIKEQYPHSKIAYICSFPDVLKDNPAVDQVLNLTEVDDDLFDLAEILSTDEWYFLDFDTPLKGGFDYKVHLRTKPYLNEYVMSLLKQNPNNLRQQELDFYNQASSAVITRYKMIALDMYCGHAFTSPTVKSVWYYPRKDELYWAKNFLDQVRFQGKKAIILVPHTSTKFKDYPHWKQVIKLSPLNYFWFILGGPKDSGEGWYGENVYDATGAFSLRQSFALAIEADMMCSSDTGLFYPRAAIGKPVVALYGPHEPEPFLTYFPSVEGIRIERLQADHGAVKKGMCSTGCYIDNVGCKSSIDFSPCLDELPPELVAEQISIQFKVNTNERGVRL